jgi:hypothetical protein
MIELYYNFQSDNGTLTQGHALSQWSARYLESMAILKDLRQATRLPNLMRDAGFVDVESRMIQLPTCGWGTGELLAHLRLTNRRQNIPILDQQESMYVILTSRNGVEQREHEIGVANRENIQRMLNSLAIFPFTERLK